MFGVYRRAFLAISAELRWRRPSRVSAGHRETAVPNRKLCPASLRLEVRDTEGSFDFRLPLMRRIESKSEPPDLPTETNTSCRIFTARNAWSLVRIRKGPTAKTLRNRGDFSGRADESAGSLCCSRLNGGGASLVRTRLWPRDPCSAGKEQGSHPGNRPPHLWGFPDEGLPLGPQSRVP